MTNCRAKAGFRAEMVPYGPLTVNASTVDDAAMPMTPDTYSFIYESSLPKALRYTNTVILHTSREPTRPHSPLTGLWLSRKQMNVSGYLDAIFGLLLCMLVTFLQLLLFTRVIGSYPSGSGLSAYYYAAMIFRNVPSSGDLIDTTLLILPIWSIWLISCASPMHLDAG